MLNQSKEVLCICVSFQESRDSIKEEPETNARLHVFIILEETLTIFDQCSTYVETRLLVFTSKMFEKHLWKSDTLPQVVLKTFC